MPYIVIEDRQKYDDYVDKLVESIQGSENIEGDLNYIITSLLVNVLPPNKYAKINAAIGVLECAKLEYYRRGAGPYEDTKIRNNGDVYPVPEDVVERIRQSLRQAFEDID